ncbi:MAG TPA: hypothetical protein DEB09_05575 [Candidatus Magasanikbacteria bacterium]|nr:hypothetical protein [Candidatus Magasanikbacteria bacterium]
MRKIIIGVAVFALAIMALPNTANAGGCFTSLVASQSELTALNAKVINFENIGTDPITGYWDTYGVKFTAENGKAIYTNSYNRAGAAKDVPTASGEYNIANDATWPATSYNQPLKITFKEPVNVFGFYLGNAENVKQIKIKYFDEQGNEGCGYTIENKNYMQATGGAQTFNVPVNKAVDTFVGFKSSNDVYSITIDYGPNYNSESIDDLMFVPSSQNVRYCEKDDNNSIYTKGIMKIFDFNGKFFSGPYEDSCLSDGKINENICSNGTWSVYQGLCGDNYSCVDGACQVDSTKTVVPLLSNFVAYDSVTNKALTGNKVGYKKYSSYTKPLSVSIYNATKAIKFSLMLNNSDDNFTYAFIWNNDPSDGTEVNYNEQTVKSIVKSANFNSSAVTTLNLTDYYRGKYVMMYGFVRNNDGKSEVPNMPVEVDEVVPLYFRMEKLNIPTVNSCVDSDNGLDIYARGVTTGEKEGSRVYGSYSDSCSDKVGESGLYSGKWVVEQHCSGPVDKPYVHTQWNDCPNGCMDGRCVENIDYDNTIKPTVVYPTNKQILTNYPRVATLKWNPVSEAVSYNVELTCDHCNSVAWQDYYKWSSKSNYYITTPLDGDNEFRFKVKAVYADGSTSQWSDYRYFSYNTSAYSDSVCSDPDGTNTNVKGYSSGLNKVTNKPMNYVDYCAASDTNDVYAYSSDYVGEWVCKGDVVDNRISKCKNGCVDGRCLESPNVVYSNTVKYRLFENDWYNVGYQLQFYDKGNGAVGALALRKILSNNISTFDLTGKSYDDTSVDVKLGESIKLTTKGGITDYSVKIDKISFNANSKGYVDVAISSPNSSIKNRLFEGDMKKMGYQLQFYNKDSVVAAFGVKDVTDKNNLVLELSGKDYNDTDLNFKLGNTVKLVTEDSSATYFIKIDDIEYDVNGNSSIDVSIETENGTTATTVTKPIDSCYNLTGKGNLAKAWGDNKVWYVEGNNKYWFSSSEVYLSWFSDFSGIKLTDDSIINSLTQGDNVCLKTVSTCYNLSGHGYLAKSWNDNKVWYVDNASKYLFSSEAIYKSWFKDFSGIKLINDSVMNSFAQGSGVCYKRSGATIPTVSTPVVEKPVVSSGMSCGNSAGGDGLYSMCKGDSIRHSDGFTINNQAFTDKTLYLKTDGLISTYLRLPMNVPVVVQDLTGKNKYDITYTQKTDKHGAFLQIDSK